MANEETDFTLSDVKALKKAIAEGAKRVKYSDKEIEYRSLKEMMEALQFMQKELGLIKSCGKKGLFGGRRIIARHSKGLDKE